MVKGIHIFKEFFAGFEDKYTLIGGSACDLAMTDVGETFRATKDLDIVLVTEAIDPDFVNRFWEFIEAGAYQYRQKSTGERQFYRFDKPADESFPYMIELFSRIPDAISYEGEGLYTPLPMGDEASSLSALLMDEDYYELVHSGVQIVEGLPILKPEYIVLLKAKAWLDLTARRNNGEIVKGDDIKKHKNDPFRLFTILSPDLRVTVPESVRYDFEQYLNAMENEDIDLKNLGLGGATQGEILTDFRRIYGIGETE